jgi:hypothetical protein
MKIFGKALLVSLGIAASTLVSLAPASAQYYGRGYERGYGRSNLEAQKRAIKAQREAQRRPVRGEYYGGGRAAYGRGGYGPAPGYYPGSHAIPSGNAATGGVGGPGGTIIRQGPYGNYAVPVQPGYNANGNN